MLSVLGTQMAKMKVADFCHFPGQSLSLKHLPCPAQCKYEVRAPCRAGGWTHKASAKTVSMLMDDHATGLS